MPQTLYNVAPHGLIVVPNERAVMPGEAHEFSDEELAQMSMLGWSETDPRSGLHQETAWKARRDELVTELEAADDPDKIAELSTEISQIVEPAAPVEPEKES